MNQKNHWEKVYQNKRPDEVSWYQSRPDLSLALIANLSLPQDAKIIDIGGGASTLVDHLLDEGFLGVSVLDISGRALTVAKERLGKRAAEVTWLAGDITSMKLPDRAYDLWHDRAVFHFLTRAEDRKKYIQNLNRSLKPDGTVIIATFSLKGPERCSGLNVVRYSPEALQAELGESFQLIKHLEEIHQTPFGTRQAFVYCVFKRIK
ncbi:MAG: SAM-dependent methyltransferase [Candidatus Omnitrophica bacterium CG11_big_fil_rev_8_21_14_0_20_45_26]|uniref:SAM-dependent methyltransferase n=1 Tax=Candidatus Abzuiibacterium crystallinum TaxID=1974748 RepID=A0A2H0LP25_9BACT|nr:MAG: SAM-dependent methyltransferase [Candidatus Omnitrophica bacterium CG11_big_fil_rev_8_21_14_0_20_45_26]PIW65311.1 MAG: SAM-dependent methyltransferase [Candidatus Omnitrophica bacterium CG12_big_fil_rev_8_21_14_0_65_45_16]